MSRRKRVLKRPPMKLDVQYRDPVISKLVNVIMYSGKKARATTIVYEALNDLQKKGEDGMKVLKKAIESVKPEVEVRSRRVGGANYQVPVEVRPERKLTLSCRWIVAAARDRAGRSMTEKLSAELYEAANGRGGAMKKREDVHKMAEANRAFAHFRW